MKILYDISPLISEKLAVFPGDIPYAREMQCDYPEQRYQTSAIRTTLHLGAHVDAPCHYNPAGQTIEQCELDRFFGPCQVIPVSLPPNTQRILPEHLPSQALKQPRVLFSTSSFQDPNQWQDDFCAFSPALIEFLASQDVILVGIDTPSIDPAKDSELLSHQACAKTGMANLEGLVLADVPPGEYFLSALPLNIKGGDASPVRAVLAKLEV